MDINGKCETLDGYIRENEVNEAKNVEFSTVFAIMLRGLCIKQARIYLTKIDFFFKKGYPIPLTLSTPFAFLS